MFRKSIVSVSVATLLGVASPAALSAVVTTSWDGLFTLYSAQFGGVFENTSYPYYNDPTWGYGLRTQVSGTFTYDTSSGTGTGTVAGFWWGNAGTWQIHDLTLQNVGDGMGGGGTLIEGDFLFDWNGNNNVSASIIWDASGFLGAGPFTQGDVITGTGALPASNGIPLITAGTIFPIGPAPFATTTIDAVSPLVDDGEPGVPMTTGPWLNFAPNLDVTSMSFTSVSDVPVPAAIWLFGSGLLGLAGLARRKRA
jgi:hypothetical protein